MKSQEQGRFIEIKGNGSSRTDVKSSKGKNVGDRRPGIEFSVAGQEKEEVD